MGVPAAVLAAKNAVTKIEQICQSSASPSQAPLLNLDQRVSKAAYILLIKKTVLMVLTLNPGLIKTDKPSVLIKIQAHRSQEADRSFMYLIRSLICGTLLPYGKLLIFDSFPAVARASLHNKMQSPLLCSSLPWCGSVSLILVPSLSVLDCSGDGLLPRTWAMAAGSRPP